MDIPHSTLEKAVASFAKVLQDEEGVYLLDNEVQDIELKLERHLLKHCSVRVVKEKENSA